MKQKVQDALNGQLNWELYSAYIYLSMSAYFESLNLKGFANWMRVQTQEEMVHAMKFYSYITNRGGKVIMASISGPHIDWNSPLAAFEEAYVHEKGVTERINKLVDLSLEEKDYQTNNFLQWFVNEQIEEESSVDEISKKLILIGKDGSALLYIDNELAQRVFTPPVPAGDPGAKPA